MENEIKIYCEYVLTLNILYGIIWVQNYLIK